MLKNEEEPRVQVEQRVNVTLSREEVEYALRCWVGSTLAAAKSVPEAKSFSDIVINVLADNNGGLLAAVAVYEPAPQQQG